MVAKNADFAFAMVYCQIMIYVLKGAWFVGSVSWTILKAATHIYFMSTTSS